MSLLHPPVPQLLSVPFFLQPKAMHLAASGLSKAGTGLTTSHQLQHRSLGSWCGGTRCAVRRGGARAVILSSTRINSVCPGGSPHTGGRGLVKGLSQWGPAWHSLRRVHHGTGDGGRSPEHLASALLSPGTGKQWRWSWKRHNFACSNPFSPVS